MTEERKRSRMSTTRCEMPSRSATYLAMPTLQHPRSCHFFEVVSGSSGSHVWRVTPWTWYPCSTRSAAATELSTPPDMPTTTVFISFAVPTESPPWPSPLARGDDLHFRAIGLLSFHSPRSSHKIGRPLRPAAREYGRSRAMPPAPGAEIFAWRPHCH